MGALAKSMKLLTRTEHYAAQAAAAAVSVIGITVALAASGPAVVVLGQLAIVAGIALGFVAWGLYRDSERKRRHARRVVAWLRDQGDRVRRRSDPAIENWRRIVGKNLRRRPFRREVASACLGPIGQSVGDSLAYLRTMSEDIDRYIE
jgi:hypothetical protein